MKKYIPTIYKKNIYEINYKKLKKDGINCLVFDLDNTIALIDEHITSEETKKLFEKLRKDFLIVVISNNTRRRVEYYCNQLEVDFVPNALKPFTRALRKIRKKYSLDKDKMVMIGDQIMTDIITGNKFKIKTILVDPLSNKDLKITSLNRYLEGKVIKKLTTMNILERGKYYE